MTRRLRKHPQHHPDHVDREHPRARKLPFGLIWLVLAALVLVLVIGYDRRAINQAEAYISKGKELEQQALYVDALGEYEQALKNSRLGRRAKAGVALAMADIYYEHLEDFPSANRYYGEARQISAAALQNDEVQERARMAATKSKQAGVFARKKTSESDGTTTRTVVQRVELLQEPLADVKGPVVATYNGGEIHAGQLLRALEKRPEFLRPDFREDPDKLKEFINSMMRDTLAYEAAVRAGVHKDPDVTERLYDYQKSLVAQRYAVDRRDQAMLVDNDDVEKYYNENKGHYIQPGQIRISLIKAESESSATELLQMLRNGVPFADVATSYSVHKESASRGGDIGTLTEGDTTIPGVGEIPRIIDALFKMPVQSVTEVTPATGAFYVFKVTGLHSARNVTLDEARPSIENILRGRAIDQAKTGLDSELQDVFEPELEEKGIAQFWDFALGQGSFAADSTTTATTASTTASDAITTTAAEAR